MTDDTKPWDQLPDESDKAFAAFKAYRDIPTVDRTLRKAARAYYGDKFNATSHKTLEGWSAKFAWKLRVRQYEADRDQRMREQEEHDIREMRRRHIEEGEECQHIGIESLRRVKERMERDKDYAVSPGLALQLIQQGSTLERLARGEPTEITGQPERTTWTQWVASKREERGLDPDAPNPFVANASTNGGNGNGTKPPKD